MIEPLLLQGYKLSFRIWANFVDDTFFKLNESVFAGWKPYFRIPDPFLMFFFAEEPFSGLFVTIALLFGNTLILFHASACKLYLMLMLSFWCGVSRRDIGSYLPKHDKSEKEHAGTCGENLLEPAQ